MPDQLDPSSSAPATNPSARALPRFIEPMLASPGEAFDDDAYLFEIKWDGTRSLAFVEGGARRMVNRRKVDMTARYPELSAALAHLPAGTVLDGEVVVLGPDGKPDFNALQSREQATAPGRPAVLAKLHPATFVAFDQLYRAGEPILKLPCVGRRALCEQTVAALASPRVIFSSGVVGDGRTYFEYACEQNLEGMVAKRLDSPYLPGKRTEAWIKVKRQQVVHCLVIGFVAEGDRDFGALIIAAEENGAVRCVGKVGTGFDLRRRRKINAYLWSHLRDDPVLPTGKYKGRWVEPGLYCAVRCMERTADGHLRRPAVVEVYDP